MNFDYDDGLPFPKYPVVGWSSAAYINCLTKEGVSQELSFFGDLTGKLLGTGIQMIAGSGIIGGNFNYQPQHMYSPWGWLQCRAKHRWFLLLSHLW